jgi:hypothetical protein
MALLFHRKDVYELVAYHSSERCVEYRSVSCATCACDVKSLSISPPFGRLCTSISDPRKSLPSLMIAEHIYNVILSVSRCSILRMIPISNGGITRLRLRYRWIPRVVIFLLSSQRRKARHPSQSGQNFGNIGSFMRVKSHNLILPNWSTVLLPSLGATYYLFIPCAKSVLSHSLTIVCQCVHST